MLRWEGLGKPSEFNADLLGEMIVGHVTFVRLMALSEESITSRVFGAYIHLRRVFQRETWVNQTRRSPRVLYLRGQWRTGTLPGPSPKSLRSSLTLISGRDEAQGPNKIHKI